MKIAISSGFPQRQKIHCIFLLSKILLENQTYVWYFRLDKFENKTGRE
jgi:hypothetical protein